MKLINIIDWELQQLTRPGAFAAAGVATLKERYVELLQKCSTELAAMAKIQEETKKDLEMRTAAHNRSLDLLGEAVTSKQLKITLKGKYRELTNLDFAETKATDAEADYGSVCVENTKLRKQVEAGKAVAAGIAEDLKICREANSDLIREAHDARAIAQKMCNDHKKLPSQELTDWLFRSVPRPTFMTIEEAELGTTKGKIHCLKKVRERTGLGLLDTKVLVEQYFRARCLVFAGAYKPINNQNCNCDAADQFCAENCVSKNSPKTTHSFFSDEKEYPTCACGCTSVEETETDSNNPYKDVTADTECCSCKIPIDLCHADCPNFNRQ